MRCDLAVVGGGPAGASAALAAAEGGLSVVVLERRRVLGQPVQCAEYVPHAVARWARLTKGAVAVATTALRTVLPGGEAVVTRAPGFVLRRDVFDRELAERAGAAGARLLLGAKAFLRGGELRFSLGGHEETLEAKLVLGADGPASSVGRMLGRESRVRHWAVAWGERWRVNQPVAEPEIHFRPEFPGGYAWIFPRGEDTANIGVAVERNRGNPRQGLRHFLDSLPQGPLADGLPLATGGGLVPTGGMLPVLASGKFFLAGDAAGLAHPVTGAGILPALVSGTLAGRWAVIALGGRGPAVLAGYRRELEGELGRVLAWGSAKRSEMLAGWTGDQATLGRLIRRTWPVFPEYHAGSGGESMRETVKAQPQGATAPAAAPGVRTSLAAAITLGLEKGRFAQGVSLHGLNLVLNYEDGCRAACTYCGLSRDRRTESVPAVGCGQEAEDLTTFIRVKWPAYSLDDILLRAAAAEGKIKRVCVGMLTHQHCLEDAVGVIRAFREKTKLPISALVTATLCRSREDMESLRDAGADRMAVAVDTATPELFDRHRGRSVQGPHRWGHYWRVLKWGVEVFGRGRAGCHLVVGLGETEEQMVRTIQEVSDLGAVTHLFSFFPEEGSPLEDWPQPSLGQYRRVQLARYLIDEGLSNWRKMRFSAAGQAVDFGCPTGEAIAGGRPFMTPGCPDEDTGEVACNRPYGNERPSEPFRNFPYRPSAAEVAEIRVQLTEGLADGRESVAL